VRAPSAKIQDSTATCDGDECVWMGEWGRGVEREMQKLQLALKDCGAKM